MKRNEFYIRMILLLMMFIGLAGGTKVTSTVWLEAGTFSAGELFDRLDRDGSRPAVETKIDPVWHLIPGLEGRIIDREQTLAGWRKTGWRDDQLLSGPLPAPLVWKTITPAKKLDAWIGHPIYRGNPEQQAVSFLINVAWGEQYVPEMLAIFRREQVKATFMIEGKWAQKHPELVRQIAEDGHDIGNHSYSHPQMDRLSRSEMMKEITRTESVLKKTTGRGSRWFAPPSGAYNRSLLEVAASQGLHTILWTVDTVDWKKPSVEKMLRRVQTKMGPGVLVLMHPTEPTVSMLPELIRIVKIQKLQLVSLEKMMSFERISVRK